MKKGSEEWQFFKDFYVFRQRYYEADNDEEWFSELIEVGEMIINKYSKTEFAKFAKDLVFSHFEDVEAREKKKR